jgi:prepilin-type N-terminal cleavage/methylation domain-containing protein
MWNEPRRGRGVSRWARHGRRAALAPGGFTIVELLVVLTVVGILLGMARPHIDLAGFRIRAGVQQVGTTLLAAQRLAIKRQHNVVVAFDESRGLIRIHEDADNDGAMDAGEAVRWVELGDELAFGRAGAAARPMGEDAVNYTKTRAGLPAVTFHRNGSVSEEGGFYITSRRALATQLHPGDTHAVEIERSTGRVTWFRYEGSSWRRGF